VVLMHVRRGHPDRAMKKLEHRQLETFMQMELIERVHCHEFLKDLAVMLKRSGFSVRCIALRGDVRIELCNKIKQIQPDSVIIGSETRTDREHSRPGPFTSLDRICKKIFGGSVAEYCAKHTRVPIVEVRTSRSSQRS